MQLPNPEPWWGVKYAEQITERWLTVVNPPRDTAEVDFNQLLHSVAADFNIQAPAPGAASDLRTLVVEEAHRRLDIVQDQIAPLIGMNDSFFDRVVMLAKDASSSSHDHIVQVIKPLLTAYYPSQIIQMFTDGLFVAVLLVLICSSRASRCHWIVVPDYFMDSCESLRRCSGSPMQAYN